MRYINFCSNSGAVQTALDEQELGKPYVVYLEDEKRLDWNSKSVTPPLSAQPLTFEIISDGNVVWKAQSTGISKTIEYKLNNGGWTSITSNTGSSAPTISVISGDTIQFRGYNNSYGDSGYRNNMFCGTTADFNVKGNIMSLINGDNFESITALPSDYTFKYMFYRCDTLKNIDDLVLPAQSLSNYCYSSMFRACTGLYSAAKLKLPATELRQNCYEYMFYGCTALTSGPELPATTLSKGCYYFMFSNSSSFNYLKCLATDISAPESLNVWLQNVSPTGTFVKHPNAVWPSGASGIPEGWTIIDAEI